MGYRQLETIIHISGDEQWFIDSQKQLPISQGVSNGLQPETIIHISGGEQWGIDS